MASTMLFGKPHLTDIRSALPRGLFDGEIALLLVCAHDLILFFGPHRIVADTECAVADMSL